MAQAVVPAMQCQVGAKAAVRARPAAGAGGRVWGVRRTGRGTSGFKVMAISTASTGVVPRLEQMLNLDTKPYTDRIIAEYIWYAPYISLTGRFAAAQREHFFFLPHMRNSIGTGQGHTFCRPVNRPIGI